VVVKRLPQLTARLRSRRVDPLLHPLTLSDAPRFAKALEQAQVLRHDTSAAFAFPYHYMWTALLPYWWMEADGTFVLFTQSPDGWFMPLPPLGPGPLNSAVDHAFALMHQWNGDSPVSRVEHVMNAQRESFAEDEYQFLKAEGDYVYSAGALAALAGDHYKSQRALCNRVERKHRVEREPYRAEHQRDCMELHRRWASQKRGGILDVMGKFLLEDAESAHARVLKESAQIGVSGTVIRVGHDIAAYTFGYWLTPRTWCILLEVADRSIAGLAQWLFRDTCRIAVAQGAVSINAMEDAGLPGLRATKSAYRPTAILDAWTITRVAK
jgi:hypothetical protein